VLYVDDDRNNLTLFRYAVSAYPVVVAASGAEALALLAAQPIGVLVTDQRMPEMSGTELAERVKQAYPHVARVLLTAYPEAPEVQAALRSGLVSQVLAKPWRAENLEMLLHDLQPEGSEEQG
jgi:CheY-like chemotaxis protein